MMRICGIALAGGLLVGLLPTPSRAQDPTAGDVAGFGPKGVSNSFGYGVRSARGNGYYTGLYRPYDNTSESVYYNPIFQSALMGAPNPAVAARGWKWSPPWSASYRQGQERGRRLIGRHRQRAEGEAR